MPVNRLLTNVRPEGPSECSSSLAANMALGQVTFRRGFQASASRDDQPIADTSLSRGDQRNTDTPLPGGTPVTGPDGARSPCAMPGRVVQRTRVAAPCRVAWRRAAQRRAGVMPAAPGLRVWRHAGWRGRGRALVPSVRRSYGGRRRRGWRSRGRAWCRGRPVCAPGTMPGGAAACAEPRVRRRRGWRTFSERCFVTGGVPCGGRGAVRAVHRSVRRCREGGGVAP